MRRTPTLLAVPVLALGLALAGCSSAGSAAPADATTSSAAVTSDAMASTVLQGTFAGEGGKAVSGTVTITGDTVTLAGFATEEGPDLHFYLANGTDEQAVSAGVRIAAVSTEAAQTFTLPAGVSADDYTDLVVHCDKAKAVFGAAALTR